MSSIDPAEYVEAEGFSLAFDDERTQGKLELGVCMAVYRWDDLNTAVENSWGGPKSAEKRDWISGIVLDLFQEKIVDIQLIEETLLYAMVDEFDTEVDDESALEIAALIMKIYKNLLVGDYSLVEELYKKWSIKQQNRLNSQPERVTINEDPENPDTLSDEEYADDNEIPKLVSNDDNMDVDMDNGPIIDEDGFEMVVNKNRRR